MTTVATSIEREPSSRRAPSPDILARLKQETAAEHEAIEGAARIMDPALSLAQYQHYLEQSYGFYAPLEPVLQQLGAWEQLGLAATERVKLPLLEADLAALGSDVRLLPLAAPPNLQDVAEALGCLYVLEGSTLGGRVISRHVQARLGRDVPRRFLDGYGPATGARWQTFRGALAAAARTRNVERRAGDGRSVDARIIAGAKATFEAFTAWLVTPRMRSNGSEQQ
jgi:heme oxygenase